MIAIRAALATPSDPGEEPRDCPGCGRRGMHCCCTSEEDEGEWVAPAEAENTKEETA